jgi:hypothetical protein
VCEEPDANHTQSDAIGATGSGGGHQVDPGSTVRFRSDSGARRPGTARRSCRSTRRSACTASCDGEPVRDQPIDRSAAPRPSGGRQHRGSAAPSSERSRTDSRDPAPRTRGRTGRAIGTRHAQFELPSRRTACAAPAGRRTPTATTTPRSRTIGGELQRLVARRVRAKEHGVHPAAPVRPRRRPSAPRRSSPRRGGAGALGPAPARFGVEVHANWGGAGGAEHLHGELAQQSETDDGGAPPDVDAPAARPAARWRRASRSRPRRKSRRSGTGARRGSSGPQTTSACTALAGARRTPRDRQAGTGALTRVDHRAGHRVPERHRLIEPAEHGVHGCPARRRGAPCRSPASPGPGAPAPSRRRFFPANCTTIRSVPAETSDAPTCTSTVPARARGGRHLAPPASRPLRMS